MLKRLLNSFILAILLLGMGSGIAYGFLYRAPVSVTENLSTAYTMLPVMWNQNNTWLANNGFTNSTANNTRVQTLAGSNKPWMVADNKTLTAIPVPAGSQTNLYFTTGESEASAMDIITGYGGYITMADNTTTEHGDNFTDEWSGYLNTDNGTDKNLVYKQGAMKVFVSPTVSQKVTATIFQPTATENLTPNAAGDYTNLPTAVPAVAHYLNVDDPVLTPDDITTYVRWESGAQLKDAYNLTNTTIPSYSVINSVTVVWRIAGVAAATTRYSQPFLRLGGVETSGTELTNTSEVWATYSEVLARPGGGTWTAADFDSLQVAIGLRGSNWVYCTQVYVSISYSPNVSVSATGVASGEKTVTVRANGTYGLFEILVDDADNRLWNGNYEIGNPPTGWTNYGAGATHARSAAQAKIGTYSFLITRSGADCGSYLDYADFISYRGVTVTYGEWIYATVANRARIRIYDGVANYSSSYHSGVAGFEWLTITATINAAASALQIVLEVANGDTTAYFDGGRMVSGSTITQTTAANIPVTAALGGASVPNNANNWTLLQNNVMPYADYITMTIGGTQQVWYQPTSMILGTVLPDRATATVNNGTFVWGSNPTGVAVTLGSFTSSGQPSIGSTSDTSTRDILPPVGGKDWRPDATVSATLLANPMRPIVTAISDNTTLSEYQVWVWYGIIFVVFVFAVTAGNVRGHHLITGIAVSAAIILLVVWTIFPWWTLLVVALAIWRGLVSERSPSL